MAISIKKKTDAENVTTTPEQINIDQLKADTTKEPIDDSKPPDDPFDLDRLRISQNFADAIGVKRALLTVPVRRPDRQWFIRTHPEESYRLPVLTLEDRDTSEIYLIEPSLGPSLVNETAAVQLFTAVNRQGVTFLWPIKLSQEKGRHNEWNESALAAAKLAMSRWVRVASNRSLGAYETFYAEGELDQPEWPGLSFKELLTIAFRNRFIDSIHHELLRRLRGEA
jgi:hypothetical protein